jgi:adenylate cyclase class 2
LEGKEADIRQAADALGLDWERRILVNYLGLMMQAQSYYELDFDDLTFENFKGKHYPIGPVLAGEK